MSGNVNAKKPVKPKPDKPAEEPEPVEPVEPNEPTEKDRRDDHDDPSILRVYSPTGKLALSLLIGRHAAVMVSAISIIAVLIAIVICIGQLIKFADMLGLLGVSLSVSGVIAWTIGHFWGSWH